MTRRYNNDTDVGPQEEFWKEFEVELRGDEAFAVRDESAEKTDQRFAERFETNPEAVHIDQTLWNTGGDEFSVTVSGRYYDIQEHNQVHG